MPRLLPILTIAATLSLGACATTTAPMQTGGPYPPQAMQCDAERAAWALGRAATAEVVDEVRASTQSSQVRVIAPDQMVTMDYIPVRVNIHVTDRNAITRITCG